MEEFKNLKEIIELCRAELYTGDRNIHATLGFEELKELQCLLDNYNVHKRSNEILLTQKRELEKERDGIYADYQDLGKEKLKLEEKCEEQEKMIKLMGRTMHYICLFRSQSKYVIRKYCKIYNSGNIGECEGLICSECVANYFRKKAKGE